jgi:hypothetical protein
VRKSPSHTAELWKGTPRARGGVQPRALRENFFPVSCSGSPPPPMCARAEVRKCSIRARLMLRIGLLWEATTERSKTNSVESRGARARRVLERVQIFFRLTRAIGDDRRGFSLPILVIQEPRTSLSQFWPPRVTHFGYQSFAERRRRKHTKFVFVVRCAPQQITDLSTNNKISFLSRSPRLTNAR